MSLPSRDEVLTLDYSGQGQPAVYIEAKTLSPPSNTLDYTLAGQPAFGITAGTVQVITNGAFLMFFS